MACLIQAQAIVGLLQSKENKTFSDLPLDNNLKEKDAESCCGLQVIDINTGDVVHTVRIEGIVAELYDVVTLLIIMISMAFFENAWDYMSLNK